MTDEEVLEHVPAMERFIEAVKQADKDLVAGTLTHPAAFAVMLAAIVTHQDARLTVQADMLTAYGALETRCLKAEQDRDDWRETATKLTQEIMKLRSLTGVRRG